MTPYEHLLAKAEEIGWPAHYKNDLLVHDKEMLEGCDPAMPFMWFVRETGTYLVTSSGQGFKGEGEGILRYVTNPMNQQHRGFLWNNENLTEIDAGNFQKTYNKYIYNSGPLWKVTVTSKWRPAPWASEQKEVNSYSVRWCMDHDSLRQYVYERLPFHKQHTIEIVPQVLVTQEVG